MAETWDEDVETEYLRRLIVQLPSGLEAAAPALHKSAGVFRNLGFLIPLPLRKPQVRAAPACAELEFGPQVEP